MKINSIIDLVKDLDTSRQTKNLNKLLIRILLHLQVEFSKFKDTNSQYKVTATLRNCLNQATLYLSHDTGWEADYSTPAKRADYTIANGLQLTPSLSEPTTLYIIPQYAANADMTLSLEITDGFGTQVVEMKMADYVELYERGKHYIYNITIDSGRIEFAPPVIEDMDQIEQKI